MVQSQNLKYGCNSGCTLLLHTCPYYISPFPLDPITVLSLQLFPQLQPSPLSLPSPDAERLHLMKGKRLPEGDMHEPPWCLAQSASRQRVRVFTAHCTLVQISAVSRSHVVRPSVCPSVCDVNRWIVIT